MKYLLDTNIFLFILKGEFRQLSAAQAALVTDHANTFALSAASLLEMAMKHRKNQLNIAGKFPELVQQAVQQQRIHLLPILEAHAWQATQLPVQPTHNDPMDLLILAQAIYEDMPLLSTDGKFPWYVPHGLHLIP